MILYYSQTMVDGFYAVKFQYLMKLQYSQTITVCELRPAFAGLFIFPGLSLKCHHHSAAQIKDCTIVILS